MGTLEEVVDWYMSTISNYQPTQSDVGYVTTASAVANIADVDYEEAPATDSLPF